MPATKQRRACENCNRLKSRCEPQPSNPDVCERCWRAGKDCIFAGRRRRPRDRIADLEAQVAELTEALRAHQLISSNSENSRATEAGKRLIEQSTYQGPSNASSDPLSVEDISSTGLAFLDSRVSLNLQRQALESYHRTVVSTFPAVPISDTNILRLRKDMPILLLAIIAFPTSGILSTDVQYELVSKAIQLFAVGTIGSGNRSLELVQAILIASFWFRSRPGSKHTTAYQLSQLANSMAIDIGIAGPEVPRTPGAGGDALNEPGSHSARRTWLACFVAAAMFSVGIRRSDTNARWTRYHDECVAQLSMRPLNCETDLDFCEFVMAEKLCHQIATGVNLCNPSEPYDLAGDAEKRTNALLNKEVDHWVARLSCSIEQSPLLIWRHTALLYLHEPVLHTITNKLTFGAPIFPDNIAATDYAAPEVTVSHIIALQALKSSSQSLLDVALAFDPVHFLTFTPLLYVSRIIYALLILLKLHVAVTAPHNTYSAVLDRQELRLEQYFERMESLTHILETNDPFSFNTRIIASYAAFYKWFKQYNALLERLEIGDPMFLLPAEDINAEAFAESHPMDCHRNIESSESFIIGFESHERFSMGHSFANELLFPPINEFSSLEPL